MTEQPPLHPGAIAAATPDKAAVVMADSGETVTYAALEETANRLSQLFRAAGLMPGDHMAFCMENRAEYLPIMWGAHYAGLYYTAVSSRLTTEELAYIIEDSGSKAFITSPYKADALDGLAGVLDRLDVKLSVGGVLEGFEPFEEAIAKYPNETLPNRTEASPMLYSSGTTGRPKGVKPGAIDAPLGAADGITMLLKALFGADADSIYLSPAPLYHSAPLRFCAGIQRLGGTVVVMEGFDAEGAIAAIEKHRVTHSQWVPTMFVRMLKLDEAVRNRYDTSSLRCAIHAAAPCPVGVKQQMFDWWGRDHPRVLRGHRGKRLRVLRSRRLARPPRKRRQGAQLLDPHRWRRRAGGAGRRRRRGVLRRSFDTDVRVPQRPREDEGGNASQPQHAGRHRETR